MADNMTKTNLRQATLNAFAEGIVSENNLEKKIDENGARIEGTLTLKTGDTNFVTWNVRCAEKKRDGSENKTYSGMETVMNEYKSIADVGEEEADRVRVSNGQINPFRSRNSGNEIIGYKTNFFNRIGANQDFEPRATFEIEAFIKAIVPEMKDGEETGRVIVKGWSPTYNGIEPIDMVADAEIGEAIEANFEPGQTVKFYGDIVNQRKVEKRKIPVLIGKPREENRTVFKHELLITGASPAYDGEEGTPTAPYDASVIKAAIQERENRIEEEKANNNNHKNSGFRGSESARPSGVSRGRQLGW